MVTLTVSTSSSGCFRVPGSPRPIPGLTHLLSLLISLLAVPSVFDQLLVASLEALHQAVCIRLQPVLYSLTHSSVSRLCGGGRGGVGGGAGAFSHREPLCVQSRAVGHSRAGTRRLEAGAKR